MGHGCTFLNDAEHSNREECGNPAFQDGGVEHCAVWIMQRYTCHGL
jgi:hypothetical protein